MGAFGRRFGGSSRRSRHRSDSKRSETEDQNGIGVRSNTLNIPGESDTFLGKTEHDCGGANGDNERNGDGPPNNGMATAPEDCPFNNDFDYFSRMDPNYIRANRKTRPLKLKKKLYEFYAAPITKYYCHSVAYTVFLIMYTYICLVRTPLTPSYYEMYVAACHLAFALELLRIFLTTDATDFQTKFWVIN